MSMTSAEIITAFANAKGDIENTITKKGGNIAGGFSNYASDINSLFNSLLTASISGDVEVDVSFLKSNAFVNCSKITSVHCPNVERLSNAVFSGCLALEKVDLPVLKSVANAQQIFFNCSSLKKVYMPILEDSGTQKMFQFCTGLEILSLPVLTDVAASTFTGCTSLKIVELNKAGSIKALAFENCTSLNALIIRVMDCELLNSNAFSGTPIASGTGYIYVPDSYVEQYKARTNWSVYSSQIKGISEISQDISDELEAHKLDD